MIEKKYDDTTLPATVPTGGMKIEDSNGEKITIPAGYKKDTKPSNTFIVYRIMRGGHWSIAKRRGVGVSHFTEKAQEEARNEKRNTQTTNVQDWKTLGKQLAMSKKKPILKKEERRS